MIHKGLLAVGIAGVVLGSTAVVFSGLNGTGFDSVGIFNKGVSNTPAQAGTVKGASSKYSSGKVLAAIDDLRAAQEDIHFEVNVPAVFNNDLTVIGDLSAKSFVAQNLRVGGLVVTNGITASSLIVDTLTADNVLYSLAVSGSGLEITGDQELLIKNTDKGSDQKIFKTIDVGDDSVSAGSNTDTFEFAAGSNIGLSLDTTNKKLTITNTYSAASDAPWTAASGKVYLTTSTDSVGIGTSTPSYKLHVVGTGYVSSTLGVGGATTLESTLGVTGATSLNGTVALGDATTDAITFTGRVASGNSLVPIADLGSDLGTSSLRFNNIYVANINTNGTLSTTGQAVFTYEPTSTAYTQSSVLINPTAPSANRFLLGVGQGGNQRAGIDAEGDLTLGYSSGVSVPSTSNPLDIYGHSATQVAYIDASGNAVFDGSVTGTTFSGTSFTGTLNPSFTTGSVAFQGASGLAQDNSNFFWDDTNNRLGLGTASPSEILHLYTSAPTVYLQTSGASRATVELNGSYGQILNDTGEFYLTNNSASGNLLLRTGSATERMRITSAGLVGINSTTPLSTLDVRGNSGTTPVASFSGQTAFAALVADNSGLGDIFTASSSGLNRFVVKQSGNVGIGTSTPTSALEVVGSAAITSILSRNGAGGGLAGAYIRFLDGGNASQPAFTFGNNNTNGMYLANTNTIGFSTNGVARLTLDSIGNIQIAGQGELRLADSDSTNYTGFKSPATVGTNIVYTLPDADGQSGQFLTTNASGVLSWTSGGGASYWGQSSGALFPLNSTVDFLIGAQASTSAKFAVLNVNLGTPTASVSTGVSGIASYLTAAGSLQTANNATFTLGGSTTGNIVLSPLNSSGYVGINTSTLTEALDVAGSGEFTGSLGIWGAAQDDLKGLSINATDKTGGTSYAIYNTLNTAPGLDIYGVYNSGTIDTSTQSMIGFYNSFTGSSATQSVKGLINTSSTGPGVQTGLENTFTNNVTGGQVKGTYNNFNMNATSGFVVGMDNNFDLINSGSNNSTAYGVSTDVSAESGDTYYGMYLTDSTSTTGGTGYGLFITLDDANWNSAYSVHVATASAKSFFGSNLGLGTTDPKAQLHVAGTFSNNSALIVDQLNSGNILAASASGVTKMTLTNAGVLTVGTTATTDGSTLLSLVDSNSSCNFTADMGASLCGSDVTLKKDISTLDTGSLLDKITKLRPVSYHWKTEDVNAPLQHGFIAQDVAEQFPDLVKDGTWIDGTTRKFLNTGGLMPYVIGAVKEQQLQINQLAAAQGAVLGISTEEQSIPSSSINTEELLRKLTDVESQVAIQQTAIEQLKSSLDTLFEKTTTFLASVTFKGPVFFSSDQTGTIVVPVGATQATITFSKALPVAPTVNLTPSRVLVGMELKDITTEHFVVTFAAPLEAELQINWLATLKDVTSTTQPKVEFVLPEVTPSPSSLPSPTPTPMVPVATNSAILE